MPKGSAEKDFEAVLHNLASAHRVTEKAHGDVLDLFVALDYDGTRRVSVPLFLRVLIRNGLLRGDIRLHDMFMRLEEKFKGQDLTPFPLDGVPPLETPGPHMDSCTFAYVIGPCAALVVAACAGHLRCSSFARFRDTACQAWLKARGTPEGKTATYIPELAFVDPNLCGVAVTTVDGQQCVFGDSDMPFTFQSTAKVFTYLLALQQHSHEYVHASVGFEPSGRPFNELVMRPHPLPGQPRRAVPHNPLINAGAIMCCSMVNEQCASLQERLALTRRQLSRLVEGSPQPQVVPLRYTGAPRPVHPKTVPLSSTNRIGYDAATHESESETADRNWCLGYMMKDCSAFPATARPLKDTLEFYFGMCSTTITARSLSTMAATLANGGTNPFTGKPVFNSEHVRSVLPIMLTCGMYDFSGRWAFEVGVPAKSGVSGAMMLVVPNVCGIALWSPRLDSYGNSTAGLVAASYILQRWSFSCFEGGGKLSGPRASITAGKYSDGADMQHYVLYEAAANGHIAALQGIARTGANIFVADYDGRTAAHFAASHNQPHVLALLAAVAFRKAMHAVVCSAHEGDDDDATVVEPAQWQYAAHTPMQPLHPLGRRASATPIDITTGASPSFVASPVGSASSAGDVIPVPHGDRERGRDTEAARVAAMEVVAAALSTRDLHGATPLDISIAHGHRECADVLRAAGAVPHLVPADAAGSHANLPGAVSATGGGRVPSSALGSGFADTAVGLSSAPPSPRSVGSPGGADAAGAADPMGAIPIVRISPPPNGNSQPSSMSAPDLSGVAPSATSLVTERAGVLSLVPVKGRTVCFLFAAAGDDLDELAAFAVQYAEKVVIATDRDGRTTTMLAAAKSHPRTLSYLLSQARMHGVEARVLAERDRWGATPLQAAADAVTAAMAAVESDCGHLGAVLSVASPTRGGPSRASCPRQFDDAAGAVNLLDRATECLKMIVARAAACGVTWDACTIDAEDSVSGVDDPLVPPHPEHTTSALSDGADAVLRACVSPTVAPTGLTSPFAAAPRGDSLTVGAVHRSPAKTFKPTAATTAADAVAALAGGVSPTDIITPTVHGDGATGSAMHATAQRGFLDDLVARATALVEQKRSGAPDSSDARHRRGVGKVAERRAHGILRAKLRGAAALEDE